MTAPAAAPRLATSPRRAATRRPRGVKTSALLRAIGVGSALGLALMFVAAAHTVARAGPFGTAAVDGGAVFGVSPGMTLGDARAAQPKFDWLFEPAFMVDFSAVCAQHNDGSEMFCALIYETDAPKPEDKILALVIADKRLSTRDGVRVGMTFAELGDRFGDPTISYSWDDEARELITFADAPDWLSFRGESAGAPARRAGDYPPAPTGRTTHATNVFAPGAVITEIWIN